MTLWCKLLALAAGLPGLAAAADPEMMNLVMPDASVVMEVNIAKIMASPIGSAMGEAVHQGIAKQLKVELTKVKPQFQEQIAGLSNIDWSREVRDIVIASGPGKPLVMPDASVVMEVNIAKIMASPIGSAMGEAMI